MNVTLFLVFHLIIGLVLIYFYGNLPKRLTAFLTVVFAMSFIYFGSVIMKMYS